MCLKFELIWGVWTWSNRTQVKYFTLHKVRKESKVDVKVYTLLQGCGCDNFWGITSPQYSNMFITNFLNVSSP